MKKQTKIILSILALVAIIAGVIFYATPDNETGEYRIGLVGPLTGPVSYWANSVAEGVEIAVQEHNLKKPKQPVRLLREDSGGEVSRQIASMRKLCSLDQVHSVVSVLTPTSLAIRPLAEEFTTPLVGTVVGAADFGELNRWSFLDYPLVKNLTSMIATYTAKDLKLLNAVALVVNDEYGASSLRLFQSAYESKGGRVLASESVAQTELDMRPSVTSLMRHKPEVVFLVLREKSLGTAVKRFRELGFLGQIIGINGFDSPAVWEAASDHGEGVIFSNAGIDYTVNPAATSFRKSYELRFGRPPSHTQVYGYSIAKYLIDAIVAAGGDHEQIRGILQELNVETIRGRITMQPSRYILSPVGIFERRDKENHARLIAESRDK